MTYEKIVIPMDHGNRNMKTKEDVFTSGLEESDMKPILGDYLMYGLDKTIQYTIDGSCNPGIFSLVSVPNIVGCVGAAIIIIAAIATPIAKSQHMREIWFYVMSGGVMLKIVVMEIARIIQMFQECFHESRD